ncbi:MAG: PQQ-binding-like beta-propeller repeat protein [Phycisphaerales bacterium]
MKNKAKIITALAALTLAGTAQSEIILFGGPLGIVNQLDTDTGAITFRGTCGGPINSMVSANNTLFIGDQNGTVYTLDLETDQITGAFGTQTDANAMAWLNDQLLVADSNGTIDFIDPDTHQVDDTLAVFGTDIAALGIDSGGLFTGGQSTLAQRTQIGQDNFQTFAVCAAMINSMAFGPDTLYLGGIQPWQVVEGTIYLFDKFEGGVQYTGSHQVDSDATATLYSQHMLYIAGSDGIIHEMDPATGDIIRTFETGIDIQAMTLESPVASCPADLNVTGDVDHFDISQFLTLFQSQLVPADINADGSFDFFDISEYLAVYANGCD